jgi:hypothetical protein
VSGTSPRKITIEFDNGTKIEEPFDSLPENLQSEILRQPFASRPRLSPDKTDFVLMEWEDGWKEVVALNSSCTNINRYYVISRSEDVGRLSRNRQDGYPELIEIGRRPLGLKKITFVDTFYTSLSRSDREGKKTDHFFSLNRKGDSFAETVEALKKAAAEEGLDLGAMKNQDPKQHSESYEKIRRKLGIRANQRQQDVQDFLAYLVKTAS